MANYPGALSTNANLYIAVNGLQTTLAVTCTSGATTLTLTSTTGFPTTGLVTIDNTEVVSYTGVSGATITGCTRGADGTTAASHLLGVTVGLTVVAAHHNLLKDEIIAIETALGTSLSNVQAAGSYLTALTGDVTAAGPGSSAATLAVVNSNVGSFTLVNVTVNAKGLITAASSTTSTGTGSVVLATNAILVTPNLGTPSAVNLTNATALPNSATTATPNATASTIMSRDANVNSNVNAIVENFSTTVTAAGTTALTVSSSPLQQFTGTTTQTVTLPDATTLTTGYQIFVMNRSTGAVTVNNHGGTLQSTVATSNQAIFTCSSTGSSNGTWDVSTSSAASGGTVTSVSGTTNQITSTGGTTPVLALASPTTTPGAVTVSGNLSFDNTSTHGVAGTTTNDDAASGNVGYYISSSVGTTIVSTTNTGQDITTISLTAGDWNVTGMVKFSINTATWTAQFVYVATGESGNSFTNATLFNAFEWVNLSSSTNPVNVVINVSNVRVSIASTTTIQLKVRAKFSAGTPQAEGSLTARRIR